MEAGRKKELKQLLLDLISVDTTEGNEEAAGVVKTFLDEHGVEARFQHLQPGDANVIASLPSEVPTKHKLVLSGHLDVVPPGDLASWKKCKPFEPQEHGDLIYGRGSADMKGGVVSIIGALLELAEQDKFEREIIFLGTADEESGMNGSKKYIAEFSPVDVDFYVITEPTDLKLGVAEKGILWLELLFRGKSSHGSRPDLGRNAIRMATRSLETIERLLPNNEHGILGKSTMNTGVIRGGTKINVVPDECRIEVDFRLVPGVEGPDFLELIERALLLELGPESFQTAVPLELPAIETPLNHPFVSVFKEVTGELLRSQELIGLSYATDAGILCPFNKTPFLLFGPGDPAVIHAPDEFINFKDVVKASQCLAETVKRYCSTAKE
ncbi:MAG: M20 family metallopeptidase [Candidatus Odinarchaeota archaeon]